MEKGLISVDRFTESSQAYFLTHLHTDHTHGLTSKWERGPLFCSKLTAKLLPFKFPDFNLSLLRVVDLHIWHSFSLISPTNGSQITSHVMALDADHCPGKPIFYPGTHRARSLACSTQCVRYFGNRLQKNIHYFSEITFFYG